MNCQVFTFINQKYILFL